MGISDEPVVTSLANGAPTHDFVLHVGRDGICMAEVDDIHGNAGKD